MEQNKDVDDEDYGYICIRERRESRLPGERKGQWRWDGAFLGREVSSTP